MTDRPVTEWIRGAESRDPHSEQALWNHYFSRVARLARSRMFAIQAAVYDEEDAAVSALNSLFRGIRENRFPELHHRHNLWRLLSVIVHRKVTAQRRREAVRPPHATQGDSDATILEIVSVEPTPEYVAEMMDETERLLNLLPDERLRRITLMKMDGFTTGEIADALNSTSRTIRRKLERVRDLWGFSEDS